MANIEITNNSTKTVVIWDPVHEDDTLLAAGAVTYAAGTVLGRITASGFLTHYASGAADGSQVPVAVLHNEQVFTGAGNRPFRPIIGGRLRRGEMVAHGVGAITVAEADQLRDYGIVTLSTTELSELDNQ